MTVIGFVPARGGSQRIPRKNLRTVDGIPLVARTVRMLRAAGCERVVVSTDDQEIADVAGLHGAEIDVRPSALAGPQVRVDQVVDEWCARWWPANGFQGATADDRCVIVVAQPTSPLLLPSSVANAIDYCRTTGECVFSVVPERGLLWSPSTVPLFDARRNSTDPGDAPYFRETGGVVVFDAADRGHGDNWPPMPRVSMEVDVAEAIDIDDYADLVRARAGQMPSTIQLRYVESTELGHGHRKRCEALAVELMGRHVVSCVHHDMAPLPIQHELTSYGGPGAELVEAADVVILDILDTTKELIEDLRAGGVKHVVSLEDLGTPTTKRYDVTPDRPHLPFPDLTVNELYRGEQTFGNVRWGPKYAVLRPEFQGHPLRGLRPPGATENIVVVSFGGTDPSDMTMKVMQELMTIEAIDRIRVIMPPGRHIVGASAISELDVPIDVIRNPVMAREFLTATLAVTSSGRTVHEAAACGVPVVAVAVNVRELQHSVCPGVTYLAEDSVVVNHNLRATVGDLLSDPNRRAERARMAYDAVDGLGAQRIAWLIDGLLGGMI